MTEDILTGKSIRRMSQLCKLNTYKRKFKLTREDILNIKIKQNSRCPICKTAFKDFKSHYLVLDHNHKTSQVRGILCRECNLLLGHAKDDLTTLKNAIRYVKKTHML